MAKIVHVALKVDDLEKASAFYENVLGFKHTGTSRKAETNSHVSRHLSNGEFDLALMKYDSEDAPEARLSGEGPCIHHYGVRVDDPLAYEARLREAGCEILSAPGELPVKFRDPGGIVGEVARFNKYVK